MIQEIEYAHIIEKKKLTHMGVYLTDILTIWDTYTNTTHLEFNAIQSKDN